MSEPTVLLLDDDVNTLLVLHAILERTKARVIECESENSVLRASTGCPNSIDLMVADVVLPESSGPEVVRKVKPMQPSMRQLFISGYSLAELLRRGLIRDEDLQFGEAQFLQKPFTAEAFLTSVQNLLPS